VQGEAGGLVGGEAVGQDPTAQSKKGGQGPLHYLAKRYAEFRGTTL
jgi:hypothetical protein